MLPPVLGVQRPDAGANAATFLLPHPWGDLATANTNAGVYAFVIGVHGDVRAHVRPALVGLAAARGHEYVAVRVSPPADYQPMEYPCPGDESSTCMDTPSHYDFAVRGVSVSGP